MACDTCGHTMQGVCGGEGGVVLLFHCARCGTIRDNRPGSNQVCVPTLVGRVRKFIQMKVQDQDGVVNVVNEMVAVGIVEAVHPLGEGINL